jgi:two-component system sensor histidine kinase KdpD
MSMPNDDVGSAAAAGTFPRSSLISCWRHSVPYLGALSMSAFCTAAAFPFYPGFNVTNVAMLYLLGTAIVALRIGRGPAVLTSVVNMLALDFFFIPPLYRFDVQDTRYVFTLWVTLVVAIVIANMMVSIRHHQSRADARERRTAILYAMSRELIVAPDSTAMAAASVRHIREVFHCRGIVLIADGEGRLSTAEVQPQFSGADLDTARAVIARGERRIDEKIYLPLRGTQFTLGALVIIPSSRLQVLATEQLDLLEAFAGQLTLALERARAAKAAERATLAADRVLLSNTLLASISHDLRTPLAAIAGAGSLLAQPGCALNADRSIMLGKLIECKAQDMTHLLSNILKLAHMEAGRNSLCTDWHAVVDLVSHALRANEAGLAHYRIVVNIAADLPSILVDAVLIVQVLGNLLENAAKYTPPGTTITVSAEVQYAQMQLVVADDGPGLPPGDPRRLLEKFQRGRAESNVTGVGLGLSICRAAARLHGGDIRVMNNTGGGARFEIDLPVPMLEDSASELDRSKMSA